MRLLLFNLATDADDPVLGFTTRWIHALAERVEFIRVLTMRTGRFDLPGNVQVYSVGKEKRYSEPRRALEFYRILGEILWRDRIDVCFSHMMPLFTVLAAPILKAKAIPIVTWYAHPSLTWCLKAAHRFSDRIVASVATAYPYKHDKLVVVGQGIDAKLFCPVAGVSPHKPPVILCVTRLSPVKDHVTLLKAVYLLRQRHLQPFRVVLVGGPVTARDESYVRMLKEQVLKLDLQGTVHFEPGVFMRKLPPWYRQCTVHVNMTATGSGDKVVWEALSCGKISVAANEGFRETFGQYADQLLFPYGDAERLAAALHWVLTLSESTREEMGNYLRRQVVKMHALDRLSGELVQLFSDCIRGISSLESPPRRKDLANPLHGK